MKPINIGIPVGTRLQRIVRHEHWWQVWIATNDFIHGTFLQLHDDGTIYNVTERVNEGPEIFEVKPQDNPKGDFW